MEEVAATWQLAQLLASLEVRTANYTLGCLAHALKRLAIQLDRDNGLQDLLRCWINSGPGSSLSRGIYGTPH